jgi:hypothetical protein
VKWVRLFCAVAHVLCTGVYASVYDDDGDIYVDLYIVELLQKIYIAPKLW